MWRSLMANFLVIAGVAIAAPRAKATSSMRVAANPRSANRSSAASKISCGRACFRRRHRAPGLVMFTSASKLLTG